MQDKLVIVTRKTRLQLLTERYNTWRQARFYIDHMAIDPAGYEAEHEVYVAALEQVRGDLAGLDRPVQAIDREYLPNFLFGPADIVVTVGQDGLVVNTAKYLRGQALVAINPDPSRIDGVLLPFRADGVRTAVAAALSGKASFQEITMAEAVLNDGQRLLAFNDFLIGAKTHVSARYILSWAGHCETQSSSGILVSTGAGSTGWLSSTRQMAMAVTRLFGAKDAAELPPFKMEWNDPRLAFVVREPFLSKATGTKVTAGFIEETDEMSVESQMAEGGVIFSDGVEADALPFNAGAVACIRRAAERTNLVVPG